MYYFQAWLRYGYIYEALRAAFASNYLQVRLNKLTFFDVNFAKPNRSVLPYYLRYFSGHSFILHFLLFE